MSSNENQTCAFEFYEDEYLDKSLNEKIKANDFYSSIIGAEEFQRLKKISFLGAIDYVNPKNKSTRYQHSIDVAKLALYICEQRCYTREITDHVVSAALLHDIGHAPLSHSMESSFFDSYGIDHHIASSQVVKDGTDSRSITKILKKNVDISIVLNLIEQKSEEHFSDVFNSKMNVDTIDGIHKSLAFVNIKDSYDKYSVAKAAFIESENKTTSKLDYFWSKKDFIYKTLITSGIGAVADHISKDYFYDNLKRLDESFFLKKESSLLGGRNPIFKDFSKKINSVKCLDKTINDSVNFLKVKVIEREYKIKPFVCIHDFNNLNEFIHERYEVEKLERVKNIGYVFLDDESSQYSFFG